MAKDLTLTTKITQGLSLLYLNLELRAKFLLFHYTFNASVALEALEDADDLDLDLLLAEPIVKKQKQSQLHPHPQTHAYASMLLSLTFLLLLSFLMFSLLSQKVITYVYSNR